MAFKTMMGPDLSETKETFDKPVRDNPPSDFSPLVLTGYDATITGLHSYMKDGYWYVDWMECISLFGHTNISAMSPFSWEWIARCSIDGGGWTQDNVEFYHAIPEEIRERLLCLLFDDTYDIEQAPPKKDRYYYQNVMDTSFILNSSESMSIAGDRQSSAFDTDDE